MFSHLQETGWHMKRVKALPVDCVAGTKAGVACKLSVTVVLTRPGMPQVDLCWLHAKRVDGLLSMRAKEGLAFAQQHEGRNVDIVLLSDHHFGLPSLFKLLCQVCMEPKSWEDRTKNYLQSKRSVLKQHSTFADPFALVLFLKEVAQFASHFEAKCQILPLTGYETDRTGEIAVVFDHEGRTTSVAGTLQKIANSHKCVILCVLDGKPEGALVVGANVLKVSYSRDFTVSSIVPVIYAFLAAVLYCSGGGTNWNLLNKEARDFLHKRDKLPSTSQIIGELWCHGVLRRVLAMEHPRDAGKLSVFDVLRCFKVSEGAAERVERVLAEKGVVYEYPLEPRDVFEHYCSVIIEENAKTTSIEQLLPKFEIETSVFDDFLDPSQQGYTPTVTEVLHNWADFILYGSKDHFKNVGSGWSLTSPRALTNEGSKGGRATHMESDPGHQRRSRMEDSDSEDSEDRKKKRDTIWKHCMDAVLNFSEEEDVEEKMGLLEIEADGYLPKGYVPSGSDDDKDKEHVSMKEEEEEVQQHRFMDKPIIFWRASSRSQKLFFEKVDKLWIPNNLQLFYHSCKGSDAFNMLDGGFDLKQSSDATDFATAPERVFYLNTDATAAHDWAMKKFSLPGVGSSATFVFALPPDFFFRGEGRTLVYTDNNLQAWKDHVLYCRETQATKKNRKYNADSVKGPILSSSRGIKNFHREPYTDQICLRRDDFMLFLNRGLVAVFYFPPDKDHSPQVMERKVSKPKKKIGLRKGK